MNNDINVQSNEYQVNKGETISVLDEKEFWFRLYFTVYMPYPLLPHPAESQVADPLRL